MITFPQPPWGDTCYGKIPNSPFDKGHTLQIVNVID